MGEFKNLFNQYANIMASTSEDDPIEIEMINHLIDKVLSQKITAIPDENCRSGEVKVINNEAFRKDLPWWTERGRIILYNPNDKVIVDYLTANGIIWGGK